MNMQKSIVYIVREKVQQLNINQELFSCDQESIIYYDDKLRII